MRVLLGLLAVSLTLALQEGGYAQMPAPESNPQAQRAPSQRPPRPLPEILGEVDYYVSKLDGIKRPYVVCATDKTTEPKPLLLIVNPGGDGLEGSKIMTGEFASTAKKNGVACVILRPTGRGPGTLYMNYGEVDLFEAVEDVCSKYAIDRDRISVLGHSMGGAATWYLTSHYPDFFSAGCPRAGYCDYRLWEKPGGYTFRMQEWDEPSWISRSAAFLVENFQHTPLWIAHGELDRAIGGGVPVEHSREMARLLSQMGYDFIYTEVPGAGHSWDLQFPEMLAQQILWCLKQKKETHPEYVRLAAYGLRHNKSYWVRIDQLDRHGWEKGLVDAQFTAPDRLIVRTENVRTLSLGPNEGRTSVNVNLNGQELAGIDLSKQRMLRRSDKGVWEMGSFDLSIEKRHSCSGPIGDLFFDRTLLVYGSTGTKVESGFNQGIAGNAASLYKERNGGVHRGGIMGQNNVELEIMSDAELTDDLLKGSNLILYGTYQTNSVLKRFQGKLPLEFDGKTIRLCGKSFAADQTAVFAVFPHPENPERYVAVHGGVTPDAITYGSHIDMALLPDYLVYSGGKVLEWGFWGNDWQAQK